MGAYPGHYSNGTVTVRNHYIGIICSTCTNLELDENERTFSFQDLVSTSIQQGMDFLIDAHHSRKSNRTEKVLIILNNT